jgi:hypothetical protein
MYAMISAPKSVGPLDTLVAEVPFGSALEALVSARIGAARVVAYLSRDHAKASRKTLFEPSRTGVPVLSSPSGCLHAVALSRLGIIVSAVRLGPIVCVSLRIVRVSQSELLDTLQDFPREWISSIVFQTVVFTVTVGVSVTVIVVHELLELLELLYRLRSAAWEGTHHPCLLPEGLQSVGQLVAIGHCIGQWGELRLDCVPFRCPVNEPLENCVVRRQPYKGGCAVGSDKHNQK